MSPGRLDIRRYFLSIHRPTLLRLFVRRLRDERTQHLVARLLESGAEVYRQPLATKTLGLHTEPLAPDCGIPLGGYLSHWSGALYLDGLDHFVKRVLKVAPSVHGLLGNGFTAQEPGGVGSAHGAALHLPGLQGQPFRAGSGAESQTAVEAAAGASG